MATHEAHGTAPASHPAEPAMSRLMTDRMGWLALRSGQILLMIILASTVVFALLQVQLVVVPVIIALIIAAAAWPVVRWLRSRGLSAMLATWIALLSGVIVFGGIITLIVTTVRNQWGELATAASDGLDELQVFLTQGPLPIDEAQLETAREALVDFVTSSQFGTGAVAGVSAVGQFLAGTVLVLVILFFFLKDGDRIWSFFLLPLSPARQERGRRIGHTSVRVLGDYVRGTSVVALVDATAIGVGLAILQVPLAIPLAVIVFLGAFIPLIGATLAGVLAALVALVASGPVVALIVILIVIAVNQLEGNLLQPVVMAQSLKLHPLVILVALTAGTILGGITGAVLSVPLAAVTWTIMKNWTKPAAVAAPETVADTDLPPAAEPEVLATS